MEFNTNKVQEGVCEEILKNHKLNTYNDFLEELYDKSYYFKDMVDSYEYDENIDSKTIIKSATLMPVCFFLNSLSWIFFEALISAIAS